MNMTGFRGSRRVGLLAVSTSLWLMTGMPAFAGDWPQFRGPNCSGISASAGSLPTTFSDAENVRWSHTVGDGVGGAVVANGRVLVSGMTGSEQVSLMAFDKVSGKKLWQRDWATGKLPEIHHTNSHASSTPAADDKRVYFYFSTLGLLAVDAETGGDVWQQSLPVPFFIFKWGAGMSPVLYQNLVLFCQDDDLSPALYAFDRATGELKWKDERLDMAVNYSHPVINTVNGRDEIVVAGTGLLVGYDPLSGERRWTAKTLLRNIKTTPVCRDGIIYVSVQSAGIANQWLAAVDQAETGNKDGRIDRAETQAYVGDTPIPETFFERTFGRGDLNNDGFLEGEELDLAFLHPDNFAGAAFTATGDAAADELIVAVQGGGAGDVTQTHVLWKQKTKHTDHVVSPLLSKDQMLLIKSGGIRTVFDLADGKMVGGPGRVANAAPFFASPVSGDGKIFLASENGTITVLREDSEFKQLAMNDMGESIVATPAISDDALYVRTRTKLLAVGE